MKTLLTLLLLAASAFGQTATISDTIRTPFGGTFSGTVTVSLNSPALAQPLYSGSVTLSGWTQAVTVTAGVFTLTLYTNDLITPGGTSYTATYAPTSGSGWKETWIVPSGATTIREIRSTTVPSPSVRFTPSQITQAGATLGQGLKWDGSKWAPADVVANPMTTNGDLITRSGGVPVRVGIGSTNQVLTVSGGMPVWASGITGNASTATALAANGTNCSAGSFPLGVDASGNAESCTAAVTASTGLSDSADIVRGGAALTTPGSVPFVTASGVLGQSANLFWDNANGRLGVGTNAPGFSIQIGNNAGAAFQRLAGGPSANQVPVLSLFRSGVVDYTISTHSAGHFLISRDPAVGYSDTTLLANSRLMIAATTGNLLLGTTTDDGTNRLQVAGTLSAFGGTFNNTTPTTGSTSLVVRAGAGQGSNNLTNWQNSSGSTLTSISFAGRLETSAGVFFTNSFGAVLGPLPSNMGGGKGIAIGFDNQGDGAVFARQYLLQGATATTTDTGIARFAAGRLELNSGTGIGTTPANARDIMLRRTFAAETTTDPSAADLTIAGSNTQDVAAIYVKNDKLVVAYNRSGTVNYLTIPLDGATTTFTQSTTAP